MKKTLILLSLILLVPVSASAQVQTEIEYGISDNDLVNAGFAVSYDFDFVPLAAGIRFGKEKRFEQAPSLNPTHYSSLFVRAYSGKGMLRTGLEMHMELNRKYTRDFSDIFNTRSVYFRPCLSCFTSDCFGISLNPFRFIWWSDDVQYGSVPEEMAVDFKTVSVSVTFRFPCRESGTPHRRWNHMPSHRHREYGCLRR